MQTWQFEKVEKTATNNLATTCQREMNDTKI